MAKMSRAIFSTLAAVCLMCLACFGFCVNAEPELYEDSPGDASTYVVKNYNIDIVYDEHNIAEIVETYKVYFNKPSHGLLLKRPLIGEFFAPNGSSLKYSAKIHDISVNDKYKISREKDDCVFKIGDPDKEIVGEKNYVVKYKYELGRDRLSNMDHVYYNLVDNHAAVYENVTFSVTLPKEFDPDQMGFTSSTKGSTASAKSKVKYEINGTKITGRYDGALNPREQLTIRCVLPEGYFSRVYGGSLIFQIVVVVVIILACLFAIIALRAYKKDAGGVGPLVKPVEFYPPDSLNSVEVAYIHKNAKFGRGQIKKQDVMSFVVYLANKGYIKISSENDNSKNFIITKVKDYDGDNDAERQFFEGLFESGKDEVTRSDLYDKFYKVADSIAYNINARDGNMCKRIFSENSIKALDFSIMFSVFIAVFSVITTAIDWLDIGRVIDGGVYGLKYINIPAVLSIVAAVVLGFVVLNNMSTNGVFNWLLSFSPWLVSVFILCSDQTFLAVNCVGLVCHLIIMIAFLARSDPRYTEYGHEITGRVEGFRNFLLTAEKERLELLVEDNPEYFYNILPYTYVFGISNKWIKKFESIAIEKPQWYASDAAFDVYFFNSLLHSISIHALDVDSSSKSGGGNWASTISGWGSGSSGSGGGVSGGGYGGGSSSSW